MSKTCKGVQRRLIACLAMAVAMFGVIVAPVWSEDMKELTIELFDRGNLKPNAEPVDSNLWTRYVQKEFGDKYGYKVKFVLVPRGKEVDQLNILMGSGSAPDLVFTYDRATIQNYVKQGGLIDLKPYLDQHGKELKAFLGNDVLDWGILNGKQFAIPAKRVLLSNQATMIRKDWLDKLKMPLPKTTQEFYNTMKAFKEKDPGNVGKDKVIPYQFAQYGYQMLAESFIKYSKLTELEYKTLNWNLLSPGLNRPGFKDGMRFLNKMVNEGLATLDFLLDKESKIAKEQFLAGRIGCFTANVGVNFDLFKEIQTSVPEAKYVPVECFTDDRGLTPRQSNSRAGMLIAVPKYSKNAEGAIKYLNWMANPDVIFFFQNGTAGVHHTMENGFPMMIQTDDAKKDFYSGNNGDFTLVVNGKLLKDEENSVKAESNRFPGFQEAFIAQYKNSLKDTIPVILPFETPLMAQAKYNPVLTAKWPEQFTKLMNAKPAEFDKLYDLAAKEQQDMGDKAMTEEKAKVFKAEFPGKTGKEPFQVLKKK